MPCQHRAIEVCEELVFLIRPLGLQDRRLAFVKNGDYLPSPYNGHLKGKAQASTPIFVTRLRISAPR